jgi:NTP pyrophosphatase (non-canonical NTP hydrolase)
MTTKELILRKEDQGLICLQDKTGIYSRTVNELMSMDIDHLLYALDMDDNAMLQSENVNGYAASKMIAKLKSMASVAEAMAKVIAWAANKDLIKKENSPKQALKMVEEVGEVAREVLRGDVTCLEYEIGDVLVTAIILAAQNGLNAGVCLQKAYDKISNRTGQTINGTFIKD